MRVRPETSADHAAIAVVHESFFVAELVPGALAARGGVVRYRGEFDAA